MSKLKTVEHTADLCVVGGGLAGTIAALSAARHGLKVVLIQDRPVLGGNSSSEIRMWVRGARGAYNRETGLISEFEEENIYRNPTLAPTLWDSVLFGKIKENPNITLLLNASCLDAECSGTTIRSVTAWQLTTYSRHIITAKYFSDCSGDSILAPLTGAEYRIGREGSAEYNETIAPTKADSHVMGMSILLQARETDHPVKFIPPDWANVYETDEDFCEDPHLKGESRDHTIGTDGCNLWWMELGGDGEAITNTEETRNELMKVVFGVWDHIKNRGDHGCENWELEWVGFLPGKRESVRYVGPYVLTQNDIESGGQFEDIIAYGGWPMDDHDPVGIKAASPSVMHPTPSPYGIPYRCLYSKNIDNLFFAGRNISVTHAALSSTRVMGTCSLLGQAVGTAAALCRRGGIMPRDLKDRLVKELQQDLLNDGVFLPGVKSEVGRLAKTAEINISKDDRAALFNGIERPQKDGGKNCIILSKGAKLIFDLKKPAKIEQLRLMFDPDFTRESITPHFKLQLFASKLNEGLDFEPLKTAATIVRSFRVFADDEMIFETDNNYHSLVKVPIGREIAKLTVEFIETHGSEQIRLFACDFA